ncbi:MAG: septum site-determining protein MinC [Cyanobacteria bacterium P01_H01_bin.74]
MTKPSNLDNPPLTVPGYEYKEMSEAGTMQMALDVSSASNSVQACRIVDDFVAKQALRKLSGAGSSVHLYVGDLLLTRGVVSKVKQKLSNVNLGIDLVYATLPQTQQAALSEGLTVKEAKDTFDKPAQGMDFLFSSHRFKPKTNPQPGPESRLENSVGLPIDLPLEKPALANPVIGKPALSKNQGALPDKLTHGVEQHPPKQQKAMHAISLPAFESSPASLPKLDQAVEKEIVSLLSSEKKAKMPLIETIQTEDGQSIVIEDTAFETLYLRQSLRSGQTVRFNGNIIVIGDAHAGCEILAGGDIVVWGELKGIAHAGAKGDYQASIRAMKIEALQLRIADYIARRPDRISYHKERQGHNFSPEIAKVSEGEIRIFKQK